MKLSCRVGNLEVRTAHGIGAKAHDYVEIVEWGDTGDTCWMVAYFDRAHEGWQLHFVGDRPFKATVDGELFMRLARIGQDLSSMLGSDAGP